MTVYNPANVVFIAEQAANANQSANPNPVTTTNLPIHLVLWDLVTNCLLWVNAATGVIENKICGGCVDKVEVSETTPVSSIDGDTVFSPTFNLVLAPKKYNLNFVGHFETLETEAPSAAVTLKLVYNVDPLIVNPDVTDVIVWQGIYQGYSTGMTLDAVLRKALDATAFTGDFIVKVVMTAGSGDEISVQGRVLDATPICADYEPIIT